MTPTAILPSAINPLGGEKQASTTQERAAERVRLLDRAQWLARLVANPDFIRFLAVFHPQLETLKLNAGDIDNRTSEQRDAYAQRLIALDAVLSWPSRNLAAAQAGAKAIEEELSRPRATGAK